jgi:hypothetical protein
MDNISMALEAISTSIFARISYVSHYVTVTTQTVVLYDLLTKACGSNFSGCRIRYNSIDIPAARISSIHASCDQAVRIMTVPTIRFAGMGRM